MLNVILAESSLELIPKIIQKHSSVISYSKKFNKSTSELLLDISWHFAAMKGLKNEIKRGRPDLIHITLLSLCTSPAFFRNKLRIYVHTLDDKVISINNETRLPKSYHRFQGLIEKLFLKGKIESENQKLMEITDMNISELLLKIKPSRVIGLTTQGKKTNLENLISKISDNSCIIIGGFQKGHFNEETQKNLQEKFSINENSLESHIVASRLVYEYEKTIFI
tara:strand:- start:18 stop:686 length:669 start_codon:yes stop_codon:yes gene_type:complete